MDTCGAKVRGQGAEVKYNLTFVFDICQNIVAQMDTLITSEKSLKIFLFLSQQFIFLKVIYILFKFYLNIQ